MTSRSCPSCHSPGPARLILDETRGNYTCDDPWHITDPYGVTITKASLPPDSDPDRTAMDAAATTTITDWMLAGIARAAHTAGLLHSVTTQGYGQDLRVLDVQLRTDDTHARGWQISVRPDPGDVTVSERAEDLRSSTLPVSALCLLLAESEARHDLTEAELVGVHSEHAAELREVNGLLDETRAVLADVLDPRRWNEAETIVRGIRQDGAIHHATATELAHWRTRAAGATARGPAHSPTGSSS